MPDEQTEQKPTNQINNKNNITRETIKRRTAYRVFVGMISQAKPELRDNRFLFAWVNHKETTRVNLIGNIIDKFESEQKPYAAITIDDGTGTVRIKTFSDTISMLKDFNQGDTVNVIGKLAFFNEEIYILPEIVKESSITWLIARKLELEKEFGKDIVKRLSEQQSREQSASQSTQSSTQQEQQEQQPLQEKQKTYEEHISNEPQEQGTQQGQEQSTKDEILGKIKNSEPEGLDIDKIILQMNKPVDEINSTITELLESGEIYEPKPGRLRIL